jgi:hypothetical protein
MGQSLSLREILVLAAACAEIGNFADALSLTDQALAAARSGGNAAMTEKLQTCRSRFAASLPLRERAGP